MISVRNMGSSVRSPAPPVRNLAMQHSVLQYGVRSLSPESGTELDSQIPVRSPLGTQTPHSSPEYGARVRSPVRSPIPGSQCGVCSGLKLRTPVRSPLRTQTPYSVLQSGIFSQLRTPVRSPEFSIQLRTESGTESAVFTPPPVYSSGVRFGLSGHNFNDFALRGSQNKNDSNPNGNILVRRTLVPSEFGPV